VIISFTMPVILILTAKSELLKGMLLCLHATFVRVILSEPSLNAMGMHMTWG